MEMEKNKKQNQRQSSYLLCLDCYDCGGPSVANTPEAKARIEKFLIALVKKLKMTQASDPIVLLSTPSEVRTMTHEGPSGWICLEESGIQIHVLVDQKMVYLDIFSCKNFPANNIQDFVVKEFSARQVISKFIKRGQLE